MPDVYKDVHAGESGEQREKRLAEEAAEKAQNTTVPNKEDVGSVESNPEGDEDPTRRSGADMVEERQRETE